LVLAGAKGWYYTTIFQQMAALGLEECVLVPGFVPAEELPDWYAAAEAFVYPSLFEGFGLPVLEAMASGTPVICSQAPGVSEVAGEAACLFPPQVCEALVAALDWVVGQPGVQQLLRQRGLEQAQRFSWRRSAAATIQVYRHTLANL
jgi:glycosyltransferase involved in cell wall biosynthesis